MEATIMEVNLCPSSNFGQTSCSVHIKGSEEALSLMFSKVENQAVVRLEHSVTAVCPENGEIQYTTIVPDKTFKYNKKILGSLKSPLPVGHKVNNIEYGMRGDSLPSAHKSFLQRHTNGYGSERRNINNRSSVWLPGRDDKANKKVVPDEPSRGRKRKNPERLDSGNEDEKKPRRNKQWSEINMQEAIMAVHKGMRVRRAAKVFAVPRTTLKYKLDGRSPLSQKTESSTNDLNKKVTEVKKEYMEAKKVKRESLPPQGKQIKDNVSPYVGQKAISTKKSSVAPCEKNKVQSLSHEKPVQRTRSLRSNSSNLEKKADIPLKKEAENSKKAVNLRSNKNVKETDSSESKQKDSKIAKIANHSPFDKDLNSTNDQEISKDEEGIKCEEKRCFKLWTNEAMKNAIHAVKKGCRIRKAAHKFGIPRSTLGRRIAAAGIKRGQLSSKSNLQENVSGTQSMVVRQSQRIQKTTSVPDTPQEGTGIQPSHGKPLLNKAKGRKCAENVKINTLVEVKAEEANAKGRGVLKVDEKPLLEERKSAEKSGSIPADDKTDLIKTRGRYQKAWSEESMEKALEAVNQGMSLGSAANKFHLPRESLKTRKYKRNSRNISNKGPEPHISPEDEDQIVNYVNDCATFGIVNVKQVGLLLTAEAAEKKLIWDIKKQGLPKDEWWDSFCARRGSHFKNVDMMQPHKRIKVTEARLSLFYDKLSAIKDRSQHQKALVNCSDCRTFTVQEFKYDLDTVTQWVGDSNGEDARTCRRTEIDPKNKIISTICCASAVGNSIPPMFVYHTENNYKIPASGLVGPFGAVHFVHDMNDLTRKSDFYFKWFEEVFLKYAPQSRPLIMLFDPDTAFITPEFIQLAQKNDILLLGLPPFSAHITQPLNRRVFPALKKGFTFTSSLFKRIFVKGVNFNNFARCFKVAWNSSVDAATIMTGFVETGIHPIDRKVILKSKLF